MGDDLLEPIQATCNCGSGHDPFVYTNCIHDIYASRERCLLRIAALITENKELRKANQKLNKINKKGISGNDVY